MIPQLGLGEMIVLAVLALVVVGPKDLPLLMRRIGQFFGRVRAMGQEFKDAFDELGHQAELDELKKEVQRLKSMGGLEDDLNHEMREIDKGYRDSGKDTAKKDPPVEDSGE